MFIAGLKTEYCTPVIALPVNDFVHSSWITEAFQKQTGDSFIVGMK